MQYSDIFNHYKTGDGVEFANILRKVQLPDDKTLDIYQKYIVPYDMPWVHLSYKLYNDISYYWLIQAANVEQKLNPLYTESGTEIYIVKPEYLQDIVDSISSFINEN